MLRSAVPMRLETNTRRGISLALAAFAVFGAACGSSSTAKDTPTPRPTATAVAAATATPADLGLAGQLGPAQLQPADVSADWHVAQNQEKVLTQRDVPGLSSGGKGSFTILA